MMNKKLLFLSLGVVIFVLGLAVYMFLGQRTSEKHPAPVEGVRLGVDLSVISAPVWVAEDKGFFQKEGLGVQIVDYPSGRTALRDMLEKKNLDIVTVAQTPVMYNSFSKNNYAILAAIACSYEDVLFLARKEKGIKNAKDLRGKKIGTPVGSSGHFFLGLFLINSGLRTSDVIIIDVDAPSLPQALFDGNVDAIAIWQPHIHNAQKLLGGKTVLLPSKNVYREDFYLVANRTFINQHPEGLKKLLKAMSQAENFIQENREDAIDIVSGRLKLNRETVNSFWDGYEFKLFLDQTILTDLEAEARWAIKNKYTSSAKIPNYIDFIYTDALKAIKPEAVNIIR